MKPEFFHSQPLDSDQLESEAFDSIEVTSPEIRAIVARNWPHLLAKLPPED